MQPENPFLKHTQIETPIICGPMYPCSNPELIAAVSNSGAMGIVQPISLTYIHGFEFREGLRYIKSLTDRPIGMNALIEKSSSKYMKKMQEWIDIALEEGVRFFITSLGNPDWVVKKVHAYGGIVYHDVTEAKWTKIAMKANVDGLIAVNSFAGGHAGLLDAKNLYESLKPYNLPIICAGGIGDSKSYHDALKLGYNGVQMGTRFIASQECSVPSAYKEAIVKAKKEDIVLTRQLTGIPLSVIKNRAKTPWYHLALQWLLQHPRSKKLLRIFFALYALRHGKKSMQKKKTKDVQWVAGKSVQNINAIQSVQSIINSFKNP